MKRKLLLILAVLPMVANAYEVEIDGLWYNIVTKVKQAEVIRYKDTMYDGDIIIPPSIEYEGAVYDVTSISNEAFRGCWGITSVIIGNNVTTIGNSAFYSCSSLTFITIPESVTSVLDYAFNQCIESWGMSPSFYKRLLEKKLIE